MRVAYRGQETFLEDQLGGFCQVGDLGVWTRLVGAEVESNVDGVGGQVEVRGHQLSPYRHLRVLQLKVSSFF